jgi:hypothetical protein
MQQNEKHLSASQSPILDIFSGRSFFLAFFFGHAVVPSFLYWNFFAEFPIWDG